MVEWSVWDVFVAIVALLVFIPVLLSGGWVVALFFAGIWLAVTKLGPEVWDLYKSRQMGASGMGSDDDGRPFLERRDN